MDRDAILDKIKEAMIEKEDLMSIISDINSYDGNFDDIQWWENDEDFFDTFYGEDVMEAVRAVCYGDYTFTDEYVKINAYGNLETTNYIQDELEGYVDEIVDHLADNWEEFKDTINLTSETKELIDEYIGSEGEEE